MADAMTFVSGNAAKFGVVDARTGAYMSLHGTNIELCVAGPSANVEVKHELYNDGVGDVCQGVLLVPIPLEWQVAHLTVEYEGEVIDTVQAIPDSIANVSKQLSVNPDLFFHQHSTTPVCSFHLPWTISIGSSLLVTTEYMTPFAQSQHISRSYGHGAEATAMCQLLLPSCILSLSHSVPGNKESVTEDYNALFYNVHSSSSFAFRLKHECSLHVIAQTFSPLCHNSVHLTKVGEVDRYKDIYAYASNKSKDINNKSASTHYNKTKELVESVTCEVKEMGDCMFDLRYAIPLEELMCATSVNRHLLLTCLLRPSLEPIRVFLDYGKKCVDHALVEAMLGQHSHTTNVKNVNAKSSNVITSHQGNSLLFDQLKTAVLIQVTPHLDSCPVNVEHIFVIDLSRSKQSRVHAQCITESLLLALHALPPSVYINVLCTNSSMCKSTRNATPALVFSDGSVPVNSVNLEMLAQLIAKMCDSHHVDITERTKFDNGDDEEGAIWQSLLSLFHASLSSSSSSSSSTIEGAHETCHANYIRCITLITNRTFNSMEIHHSRFAQVIEYISKESQRIIVNTLAITPNCNGETLAGLELMAQVGKGTFKEVHVYEFYDSHTQNFGSATNGGDGVGGINRSAQLLSCDTLTVALNEILASCTIPHLTNIHCDISFGNVDYHFTDNTTTTNRDKANMLFMCPDICSLTFAHCKSTYICFFLPEAVANNAIRNSCSSNEMSFTISGKVGKERVEYTYSCPVHNVYETKEKEQKSTTCLDARIVHQCERLIYREVAKAHVHELCEYVYNGMHANQREEINAILAFLSHEYNINNPQTTPQLLRKKKKMKVNSGDSNVNEEMCTNNVYCGSNGDNKHNNGNDDVSDEAIRFDDTFSKQLACRDQSVSIPFLHQKEILHYLLNQWTVKHRARLAHASSQRVSCTPASTLTSAIALCGSTSTVKFFRHLVNDVIDSILSYTPAYECTANVQTSERYSNNIKRLLLLQQNTGSFALSARFALCVGLPLHTVTSSSSAVIMQYCNIHSHSLHVEECWATALALAYMQLHCCKLTLLSELFCVYYFTHTAHVQRNVWESWVESAMHTLCNGE